MAERFPPKADPTLSENAALGNLIRYFAYKMASIYIIRSLKTRRIYIGSSHFDDSSVRLKEHNKGDVKSTKSGRPWAIIHSEHFKTYTEARKRENFLKTGVGRKWIHKNFDNR